MTSPQCDFCTTRPAAFKIREYAATYAANNLCRYCLNHSTFLPTSEVMHTDYQGVWRVVDAMKRMYPMYPVSVVAPVALEPIMAGRGPCYACGESAAYVHKQDATIKACTSCAQAQPDEGWRFIPVTTPVGPVTAPAPVYCENRTGRHHARKAPGAVAIIEYRVYEGLEEAATCWLCVKYEAQRDPLRRARLLGSKETNWCTVGFLVERLEAGRKDADQKFVREVYGDNPVTAPAAQCAYKGCTDAVVPEGAVLANALQPVAARRWCATHLKGWKKAECVGMTLSYGDPVTGAAMTSTVYCNIPLAGNVATAKGKTLSDYAPPTVGIMNDEDVP